MLFVVGLVGSVATGCGGENPFQAAKETTTTAASDDGTATVTTNVFLPENADVSSCVGTLERPDCGSKAKGGWRQYLVFGVLIAGLGFIGWRVAKGVRARDAVVNDVD